MASTKFPARSISLPSTSHPATSKLEEELKDMKSREESSTLTSQSICTGLSGLDNLYNCMDHLLNLNSTRQVLSQGEFRKYVDELLDESIKLLDVCSITRDLMLRTREHCTTLQSALRRRKGDSIKIAITNFFSFRKKTNKDVKRLIAQLKQMDAKFGSSSSLMDNDHHLSAVILVLTKVSLFNISIFESFLLFIRKPMAKPKSWILVSKWMHKGAIVCEKNVGNEFDGVDASLCDLDHQGAPDDLEKMQIARKRLEALEIMIQDFENGLEIVFRRLIKTRASLLNISSCQ